MNRPIIPLFVLLLLACSPAVAQDHLHQHHRMADSLPEGADRFEGTRKMIALLDEAARAAYRPQNQFATAARVQFLTELSKTAPDNELMRCQELINAGRQDEAIPQLIAIEVRNNRPMEDQLQIERMLALAYLRQGEQDNCITNHTAASCLFPIGEGGYYTIQRGPRAAIDVLRTILECAPDDLQSRWLLNVAYMTIAEYPEGVPARWLLPPSLFESEYPLPRFTNVAPQLGVDGEDVAGGSCTEDFDRDGDIDIMTTSWDMHGAMRYYRNNGDGTFTEATGETGLAGLTGGLNIIQGDYDNDGYPDVLVLRGAWMGEYGRFPNSLLHNNGDGTFSDVTVAAGLLSYHPTQTAVFADLNNDGLLDIFIGNESMRQLHPCELYVNNGDGTFTNRAHEVGLDITAFVKAVTCGDFDNDGLPDLYLSCQMQSNHLLRNNGVDRRGKWTFTDVTEKAGVGAPVASFPAFFFDYDNDGWEDIYVCGYGVRVFSSPDQRMMGSVVHDYLGEPTGGEMPKLYHNNHNGTFTDVAREVGLDRLLFGMGINFGDLDNDGWLDIYVGTGTPDLADLMPNRMFRNDGGRRFQDVTTAGGFGHLQKGHAISFGDLDNDGDQDIFTVMGGAFEGDRAHKALFENPGSANHWITLRLEGTKTNRSAIGARIEAMVETPSGERMIRATVNSGGSFGASTLQQEIGLGDATAIRSIVIQWPGSRGKQMFRNVEMNMAYTIREGARTATRVEMTPQPFRAGADAGEHHHHHHE